MRKLRRFLLLIGASIFVAACGGGGGGGGNAVTALPSTPSGDNVQAISVNAGLAGTVNRAFTSVTVCEPGTNQCKTIDNIAIDTGSSGLRVLASALSGLSLPQQNSALNHPLAECVQFADLSYAWGAVKSADVKIAAKTAAAIPIQVIGDSATGTEPASCTGFKMDTVNNLGGNGILGVGHFVEDCGDYCALTVANNYYFDCPNATCSQTIATLASQVQNPVAHFNGDNNGVVIDLPAVSDAGATRADGWMIFGIDTRSNNALGSATMYTLSDTGYLYTRYKGTTYSKSFIDSGSNGVFFPDAVLTQCTHVSGFYCPAVTQYLSATITGMNNASSSISFSVINAESLNANYYAFNNLAGPFSSGFDWGLPFFLGRKIYTALETNAAGSYVAF